MTRVLFAWLILLLVFAPQPLPCPAQDHSGDIGKGATEARLAFEKTTKALNDFNSKHSRYFRGARVPIHYLEWTGDGTPLVLLHGTYSTAHDFARFAPELIKAGYRPISVDWYGHGGTPIPKQPVSATDFTRDLRLLLKSLEIEKTVLAGHSRGGMLAAEFYKNYPNKVSGLVLIDGGSTCVAKYFASLGEKGLADWMKSGFDAETGKPLAPSFESLEELFAATWKRFGKPDDPSEMFDVLSQSAKNDAGRWTRWRSSLREWLQQDNRDNTINGMLKPSEAPLFFGSTVLFDPIQVFAQLNVPVLILDAAGSSERYRDTTPSEENKRLQKLHPHLISHVTISAGHFVHREKPDEFNDYLRKFRKQLK